jgi:hypothetical protein
VLAGVLVQYPNTVGSLGLGYNGADQDEHQKLADNLHKSDCKLVVATDLLACAWAKPPGEFGVGLVLAGRPASRGCRQLAHSSPSPPALAGGHCGGLGTAVRGSHVLRRAARRVHGHQDRVRAADAGQNYRRQQGRPRWVALFDLALAIACRRD